MPRAMLRPLARALAVSHRYGAPARVPAVHQEGVVHLEMAQAATHALGGLERLRRGPGEDRGQAVSR